MIQRSAYLGLLEDGRVVVEMREGGDPAHAPCVSRVEETYTRAAALGRDWLVEHRWPTPRREDIEG